MSVARLLTPGSGGFMEVEVGNLTRPENIKGHRIFVRKIATKKCLIMFGNESQKPDKTKSISYN